MKRIAFFLAGALLASPGAAVACACCGIDDWRSVAPILPDTDEAAVLKKLQLGPGRFRISDEDEWSISRVQGVGSGFVFKSEVGDFQFEPAGLPEHRMVDITFITQPKYELEDVADVYHEVVLAGVLRLPDEAAKQLGHKTIDVTVVLRGLGNMCWHAEAVSAWLLNSSKDPALLRGSGVIAPLAP